MSIEKVIIGVSLVAVGVVAGMVLFRSGNLTSSNECSTIDRQTVQAAGGALIALSSSKQNRLCIWDGQEKGWTPFVVPQQGQETAQGPQTATSTK